MRNRIWLLLPLLVVATTRAAELTPAEVSAAVTTWVRSVTADARPDAKIERLEPYERDGVVAAYIAHLAGGGYCLCGADDRLLPVYLYRAFGQFDPRNPEYQYILDNIATRRQRLVTAAATGDPELRLYADLLARRAQDWRALIAGQSPPSQRGDSRADPIQMTLPVTAYWHQGSPYNDWCPVLTPGHDEHCVVGCVATASAQIMYYWRWPNTGEGTGGTEYNYRHRDDWDEEPLVEDPGLPGDYGGRLEWIPDDGGLLRMKGYWDGSMYCGIRDDPNLPPDPNDPNDVWFDLALEALWNRLTPDMRYVWVNFGDATYDWSLIGDVHADPPGADDAEVAKLCEHVGVAAIMGYGVWGSSSDDVNATNAYRDHFRYDPDVQCIYCDPAAMINEIQWFRPVQIAGATTGVGGHGWVVAGYDTQPEPDEFLMNLGWGGGSNDWLSLDNCFPENQDNVIQIAPLDVVKFVGAANAGDGSPDDPYQNLAEALAEAPDGTTLVFKAGTVHTFAGTLTIDRPLTLKGYDVCIQQQ